MAKWHHRTSFSVHFYYTPVVVGLLFRAILYCEEHLVCDAIEENESEQLDEEH